MMGPRLTKIVVPALIVLMLALVACGGTGDDEVTVTEADAGETVTLDPGQVLVVRLESNPSTGFSWQAVEVPDVLEGSTDRSHEEGEQAGDVVGAPGTDVFTFTAGTEAGEGTLVLEYRRPWEEDVAAEQEYVLDVTVR